MKRLLLASVIVITLALVLLWRLADISPTQLPAATALANGLGAKLMCSGKFISGLGQQRLVDDIATYSGLTRAIDYTFSDDSVSASLWGSGPALAKFRPGLGCTLEYSDHNSLDKITLPAASTIPDAPWPAGSGGQPQDPGMQSLLMEIIATDNAAGLDTRALLVVRDGRILAEVYGPGIDRDTALLGWSMGKSLTAMMIGRLETMGRINDSEHALFPAWRDDERAAITVKNLLQMSSGLDFSEEYVPGNDSTRMLFMSPGAAAVAQQSDLAYAPGTHFSYSSGTTNLLSRLVYERAGGNTEQLLQFYQDEIATPLALENTWMELDADGVFVGSSYVYATARDWARFGYVLLNDGKINGHSIVSPDWIARAVAPNASDNDARYGYQLWLNDGRDERVWPSLPRTAYAMKGNREQKVLLLPEQDALIVRLGWTAGRYPLDDRAGRILRALEARR